ncbi:hypothetical protein B296_00041560 [Ensete ventricosum]|uniref:Uncharacterized protein n=1 Tax=Ensete ventricosum TaxID=4639 RepID=A0A426X082_ENSVE|nr:hypothetical protein B296_00041560 [Ensete ventricosum]
MGGVLGDAPPGGASSRPACPPPTSRRPCNAPVVTSRVALRTIARSVTRRTSTVSVQLRMHGWLGMDGGLKFVGLVSRARFEPDRRSDFATESGKLRELPRLGAVAVPFQAGAPDSGLLATPFAGVPSGEPVGEFDLLDWLRVVRFRMMLSAPEFPNERSCDMGSSSSANMIRDIFGRPNIGATCRHVRNCSLWVYPQGRVAVAIIRLEGRESEGGRERESVVSDDRLSSRARFEPDRRSDFAMESGRLRELSRLGAVAVPFQAGGPDSRLLATPFAGVTSGEPVGELSNA